LSQVLSEPTRKDALLDWLFENRGLVGDVMVGGSLGHSDHEMVELKIFNVMRRKNSRVATRTSGEQTLSYSGSYLAENPGNLLLRA